MFQNSKYDLEKHTAFALCAHNTKVPIHDDVERKETTTCCKKFDSSKCQICLRPNMLTSSPQILVENALDLVQINV
jgi:CxxC motif-containing protein (DUF1111 family)